MTIAMLHYDFMVHGFLASTIIAIVAGIVGYFLVLRGQTFAGHALSHVGFAGATGAVLISIPPLWGLALATVLGGIFMGLLGDKMSGRDVAIGMVLALSLGLGVLFLHFYTAYASQATAVLFGNVLGVDVPTLWGLLGLGCFSLGLLAFIARPLLFSSLQPELAEARGLSPRLLGVLFLIAVAIAVAESAQIVGVLLVFTLMVGPAATAQRLTTRLGVGVLLSALLALIEAWGGLTLAYYTNLPTSFLITAIGGALYLMTLPRLKRA